MLVCSHQTVLRTLESAHSVQINCGMVLKFEKQNHSDDENTHSFTIEYI